MALETATTIAQLNPANPSGADRIHQGDDHIRLIKAALKGTFPNIMGPVTATHDQLSAPFVMPVGIITAWFGAAEAVPAGWAICNGQTVNRTDGLGEVQTPDLRDRVVVGAGGSFAVGEVFGAATATGNTGEAGGHSHTINGGEHTHTGTAQAHALTEAELPAHTHRTVTSGQSSGALGIQGIAQVASNNDNSSYRLSGIGGVPNTGTTNPVGSGQAHSHAIQLDSSAHSHTASAAPGHQHSIAVSAFQPSGALHYIMKV